MAERKRRFTTEEREHGLLVIVKLIASALERVGARKVVAPDPDGEFVHDTRSTTIRRTPRTDDHDALQGALFEEPQHA